MFHKNVLTSKGVPKILKVSLRAVLFASGLRLLTNVCSYFPVVLTQILLVNRSNATRHSNIVKAGEKL